LKNNEDVWYNPDIHLTPEQMDKVCDDIALSTTNFVDRQILQQYGILNEPTTTTK
jgi:hypothetical protein